MERSVLGKGLGALIPKKERILEEDKDLVYVPVNKLRSSQFQSRQKIDPEELKELALSIKESGIIQPILIRKSGEEYELIAGHRRAQAAKSLGMKELPAIIKNLDDKEVFVLGLVENLQRKNLNPLEEAESLQRLHLDFNLPYEEIARMIGKNKTSVSNSIRLLNLPAEIKQALAKNLISQTQARTLLGLKDREEQKTLFYSILKQGLSVREIEDKVRARKSKKNTQKRGDLFIDEIQDKIKKALGTKVIVYNRKNNKGKIVIEYYGLTDLERILEKIS